MSSDDRHAEGTRRGSGEARSPRVPPHDFDAETALLGAAMLSSSALEVLVKRLRPEDFYAPGLGHVAAALVELHHDGVERAEPRLVADVLRRNGTLEHVVIRDDEGRTIAAGPHALLSIQGAAPATTNADRYASIVHDLATLRRVISAAGEIAELGYHRGPLSLDVNETVLRAQTLMADVASSTAESFSALEFGDLDALLAGTLPRIEPDFLLRSDGQALFYAGRMHVLHGEPSAGKSWIALVAVVEILKLGGAALYLDYEDSLAGIVSRLLALGAEPDDLRERFVYVKQDGPFGPAEKLELAARLRTLNPDLIVIDSVGESLSRDGLSEDKATDVLTWVEKLPRWLTRSGAAVVMLDHVAKDRESRGRWQRGSGAKLGVVDGAAYEVVVRVPFSRKRAGSVDLKIAKDRPGGVGEIGSVAASLAITPHADGERVVIDVGTPAVPLSPADKWKPTILMKSVSDELERAVTPMTKKATTDLVHGKPDLVREAIARLVVEGWVREVKAGSTVFLKLVKPYVEDGPPPPPADLPPTLPLGDVEVTESPQLDRPLGDDPDDPVVVHGPWQPRTNDELDRELWPHEPDQPPHPDTEE